MTLKNIVVKHPLFNRLLFILAFAMLAQYALAGGTKYHYRVKAKAQGAGLVYACTDTKHGPWLFRSEVASRRYAESSNSVSKNIYLYATPDEGYALDHWLDPNGNSVKSGDTQSFSLSDNSKTITTPDIFLYTAYFSDTYVSAYSANPELCVVQASPAVNTTGDEVTLTAITNSCTFKGWRKKGTSTILSESASYQVFATDEKITYEAVFGEYTGPQISFSRLQSKSDPSKYISLVQDEFSYTKVFTIANGYSDISSDEGKTNALEAARVYLRGGTYTSTLNSKASVTAAGDFALSSSLFDPGCIIYSNSGRFYSQGTNSYYITDGYACHHSGSSSVGVDYAPLKVDGQTVSFTNGGKFSIAPSMYSVSLGTLYVINNEGELDVTQDNQNADNYQWNQLPIDNSTNYFAFNPTVESCGKYYTTLRTAFSWKIKNPNHVKAYEVVEIPGQNQHAVLHQFADDEIIPGGMGVILESDSQDPEINILEPHDLTYTKSNPVLYGKYGTRLHCYTGLSNSGDQYDNCTEDGIGYFKVKYTKANTVPIYKLNVNDDGEVGFWTRVAQNEVISGNEAYSYTPCALFPRVKTPVITPASQSGLVAGENVAVTITCETSGATIWYSLNGGEWQQYNGEFNVTNDVAGDVTIKAKATKDGFLDSNESEVTTYTFNALTAPTISPTSAEANVGQTITFTATNPNGGSSSLQYRVDDGSWTATNGTITLSSAEVKTGAVDVKVVNGSAESETVSATYSFKSDYQSITLANLVNQNPSDTKYSITDLTAVCILDEPGLIICKDDDGYENKDVKTDDSWVDYMHTASGFENAVPDSYDQSNWIALRLPQGVTVTADLIGKHLTSVRGTLVNNINPEFQLVEAPGVDNDNNVEPANTLANTYIPASFYGDNHQTVTNEKTYFFVQPKPMEYANIEWAVSRGTKFVTIPENHQYGMNTAGLTGSFEFNGQYMEDLGLEWDHVYSMEAIIKRYNNDFEHVYILGNVDGLVFDSRKGVEMYTTDGNIYTATVTVSNATDNPNGFFGFTTKLGEYWTGNDGIAQYRFGAQTNNKYVTPGSETYTLQAGDYSFCILPGTYTMMVNRSGNSLTISNQPALMPRRAEGQTQNKYVVYPLSVSLTSESVITGVMQLDAQREVAGVEYYNLAGMRSTQPWQGINIVVTRFTDGTTTTTKRISR